MKNIRLLLCLLASSLMLAGCGGGVTPAPLLVTSLAVTPSNPNLLVGASQQFTATSVFNNGLTGGLVANLVWSSSNTQVVSISGTGLASVKAAGQVTITASTASLSGSTTVKASNKQLVSLVVTPTTTSIPLGLTKQFTATGFFNDGSAQDLTSVATWSSSNPTVATVDATGLATSIAVGSVTITAAVAAPTAATAAAPTTATTSAASGSGSGAASLSVGPAITVSVSPAAAALSVGGTQQFTATVSNTKNTAVTWSVNGAAGGNATVGTISSNGLYTAPAVSAPASFSIAATSNGDLAVSALATVAVLLTGQVSSTNNAQVAQYSIPALAGSQVQIQFGRDTNYGLETSSVEAPSGGGLINILVAGMKGFSTYHMRAAVQLSPSLQFLDSDHTFTTGGLTPIEMPAITTTTAPGMTPNPGIELLDLFDANFIGGPQVVVAAADLAGNVIWSFDGGNPALTPNPVKLLPDGNILINYSQLDGPDSILEEVDLAGNVLWQMTAAQLNQALAAAGFNLTVIGTHHDVAILPNGHLILIASTNKCFTNLPGFPGTTTVTGDALIDLDTNHVPVWTWSAFDHLDVNRHPLFFPDWTHTNAVIYSPDDGDLIISMRHQDWLLKIDYDNGTGAGDVVWRLGYQGDFQLQNGTDPVDWFYAQHGPSFASAATSGVFSLALFDNGNNAFIAPGVGCGTPSTSPCSSRAQIYQLDETAKTATITFQDKLPVFSFFGGNAELLANGNVEFDEAAANFVPLMASVLEVTNSSTPQTVWQMQINGQYAYRAMRIPSLYPGVQW